MPSRLTPLGPWAGEVPDNRAPHPRPPSQCRIAERDDQLTAADKISAPHGLRMPPDAAVDSVRCVATVVDEKSDKDHHDDDEAGYADEHASQSAYGVLDDLARDQKEKS